MSLSKIMYTARATAKGGREGEAASDDGHLRVRLGAPKEMGGKGGEVTNPEQLFAAGYAACFLSALKLVAGKQKIAVSDESAITAEVSIGPKGEGFGLAVKLLASLPGVDKAKAEELVATAHKVCPYSNATRNNITVDIEVMS